MVFKISLVLISFNLVLVQGIMGMKGNDKEEAKEEIYNI